jgi:hypothetical protein
MHSRGLSLSGKQEIFTVLDMFILHDDRLKQVLIKPSANFQNSTVDEILKLKKRSTRQKSGEKM